MNSAITLAQTSLKDNHDKKADMLIFPILFNLNHGIEVYLKAMCWSLNQLLNKKETFESSHNLNNLIKETKKLTSAFDNRTEALQWSLQLEKYIDELYSKIETVKDNGKKVYDITFARYSLTRDLEPQFYITEFDNVVIDLENFVQFFNDVYRGLDNMSSYLLDILEQRNQLRAEMESEYHSNL
ncbi:MULTISPECIES: hypothetical protein [Bacillus]|uniref:hypothetical protein n=1 Tax=Bacillus TaxID=1386 RepID=UPI000F775CDA|nr:MULTISPECIES: hypothetical protein [Bacillus]MCM3366224.1 hypothetical protein [Bacillus safensis]MDJ0289345.1 hypothetical protein [Bacillus safensis]NMW00656.1 hypothetical protein [Bacillus safensis]